MPANATRERVALQGGFPATAEVKEVMKRLPVRFIFLGLRFHALITAIVQSDAFRMRRGKEQP